MFRYFMVMILFLINFTSGSSQHSVYEGKSLWSPIQGATERFLYETGDSLRIPTGWYTMKSIHEGNRDGSYELLLLNAEMEKGVPNGQATFYHYNMRFIINNFDEKGVDASAMGERTLIRGQYDDGIITGTWIFQYGKLEDSSSWNTLYFDTQSHEWTFKLDSLHNFSGRTDSSGVLSENWNWQSGSELKSMTDEFYKGLDKMRSFLQLTGALEELEEQWYYLLDEIKEEAQKSNATLYANQILDKWVEKEFIFRNEVYETKPSLIERKKFLLETLDYFQLYKNFFKEQILDTLIFTEEYFLERFTQFWYNPYMGEHNVEVVVRKKFLQNITSNFWPHMIDSLMQAKNGYEFMEMQDKLLKYRKRLGMFPADKSSAAKRLDRKGKKETDMKNLETLIQEYIEVNENF